MSDFELADNHGHLFVRLCGGIWLLDTGAPSSFGSSSELSIGKKRFVVASDYMGLTADSLSENVCVDCHGLLGADILNEFDWIIDLSHGSLAADSAELELCGNPLALRTFMGIPIVQAMVDGVPESMFFDTGAQISYLQSESLSSFPSADSITDFYPGFGEFETQTNIVPVSLGDIEVSLRFGTLPAPLAMTLMMAGTTGIIGNEVLRDRKAGYFPRRERLVLA